MQQHVLSIKPLELCLLTFLPQPRPPAGLTVLPCAFNAHTHTHEKCCVNMLAGTGSTSSNVSRGQQLPRPSIALFASPLPPSPLCS